MFPNLEPQPTNIRMARILNPDYPLCRDDVVWVLEYMKKKVADEAPELLSLPQPLLLKKFQCFAEASMILIKQRRGLGQEPDRLRSCLKEVLYGLHKQTTAR
ncbi:hypothetical protein ACFPYJ_24215 [Paenibacillus solisilvae]|uniref:Uncharacterized protein n=1 Tax=Paenibacillus solisilvae TaxID=2486751 RepID=A0ABW0W728_9BACL